MIDVSKITIGKYIGYLDMLKKYEPAIKEIGDVSPAQMLVQLPNYVNDVVLFWTGWKSLEDKDMDIVLGLYAAIEKSTVIPSPIPLKAFELNGHLYVLSASNKRIREADPVKPHKSKDPNVYRRVLEILTNNFVISKFSSKFQDRELRLKEFNDLPLYKALNAYFYLQVDYQNQKAKQLN